MAVVAPADLAELPVPAASGGFLAFACVEIGFARTVVRAGGCPPDLDGAAFFVLEDRVAGVVDFPATGLTGTLFLVDVLECDGEVADGDVLLELCPFAADFGLDGAISAA